MWLAQLGQMLPSTSALARRSSTLSSGSVREPKAMHKSREQAYRSRAVKTPMLESPAASFPGGRQRLEDLLIHGQEARPRRDSGDHLQHTLGTPTCLCHIRDPPLRSGVSLLSHACWSATATCTSPSPGGTWAHSAFTPSPSLASYGVCRVRIACTNTCIPPTNHADRRYTGQRAYPQASCLAASSAGSPTLPRRLAH